MEMKTTEIERLLRQGYLNLTGCKRNIRWPSGMKLQQGEGNFTLEISPASLCKNMQDDANAFEGWILALRALAYPEAKYTVAFEPMDAKNPHYQRLLFRLGVFDDLFGQGSDDPWFVLSDRLRDELVGHSRYFLNRPLGALICNTGGNGRDREVKSLTTSLPTMSEDELELRLSKSGSDAKCLKDAFDTEDVYRQFPVGIFQETVLGGKEIFPAKKACVDLVADGKDGSFWLFELKKSGNTPLGILSELLFYTALVLDIVAGKIDTSQPTDKGCYDHTKLKDKKAIHACFLAPSFHPLLDAVLPLLNEAYESKAGCRVTFHKAVIDMVEGRLTVITEN